MEATVLRRQHQQSASVRRDSAAGKLHIGDQETAVVIAGSPCCWSAHVKDDWMFVQDSTSEFVGSMAAT